jgi:hypothetical protein
VRRATLAAALLLALAAAPAQAARPGASGIGDPYFPHAGNGGYDVRHYGLDVAYTPKRDRLRGVATIDATATQSLSSFNLDLVGLKVRSVRVGDRGARFRRKGGELTIVPRAALHAGRRFRVVVAYDGVPVSDGESGFIPTRDGALIAGEPDVAATWFPVNDHPTDTASYSFHITVPRGLKAIANGELVSQTDHGTRTTWNWEAREPLAPYLATASIGRFDLRAYEAGGIKYWDAIDPALLSEQKPRTGTRYALTGIGDASYKRLQRTIDVPPAGATLSFWVHRETEPAADYFLVEARTAGGDDWTTLPDREGHAARLTGFDCSRTLQLHPFLSHYQTARGLGDCSARGTSGSWWAVSGANKGYERWTIDLARYAGRSAEVSLTSISDKLAQFGGVFVDDISVSTGQGSTSFEADDDPLDGWTVPGAPAGSPANKNDWIVGTVEQAPPSVGTTAQKALARQPEILGFLAGLFGPYPFSTAGSIVDDVPNLGFALENQTRPIYSPAFFSDPTSDENEAVVVHELAHQWVGDSLTVAAWSDVWLNEGFASYAEWLWSEQQGKQSAQRIFDAYARTPASAAGWKVKVGDPGRAHMLDSPIYTRGAMTLHALRTRIGDAAFFRLLRRWTESRRGQSVSIGQFTALAERISGKQLDAFFRTWLFTPRKPPGIGRRSAYFEQRLTDRGAGLDRGVGVGGAFEPEALADDGSGARREGALGAGAQRLR